MRLLSHALFALTAIAAALATTFFFYVQGMACAFSTAGPCSIDMPWEMRGEDLMLIVILPWSVVLMLLAGAVATRRAARRRQG